tara:strand:- start:61 stop:708 length:648 start_codon:yes stop_codon:yes gene_type:complete
MVKTDRRNSPSDNIIEQVDISLRSIFGIISGQRGSPARGIEQPILSEENRAHSAGLMRVNQTGEICAQGLYQGQALVARDSDCRNRLLDAAHEEIDHLVWCNERLNELDSKPSILNPFFYLASLSIGVGTGMLGDRISLGFVEATEHQVCEHLAEHMADLPPEDEKSRVVLEKMHQEEAEHGANALRVGGVEFPRWVKGFMRTVSRLMTELTYKF